MKRLIIIFISTVLLGSVLGCDFIEEQIEKEKERIESLNFEDFEANIPERSVLIKITSDVDEQIIEEIMINDMRYDLVAQGDDWYLLEDVPVDEAYMIKNIYYRSDLGLLITFPIDFSINITEALGYLEEEEIYEIDNTLTIDDYTFNIVEDALISVESDNDFTLDKIDDWVWIILEEESPIYLVFAYEDITRVILVPDKMTDHIE